MLLRLWCRLAAASLIQPLSWELPYAEGVALKKKAITRQCLYEGELWGEVLYNSFGANRGIWALIMVDPPPFCHLLVYDLKKVT